MRRPGPATWLPMLLGASGALHVVRPAGYEWLVPPEAGPARPWVIGTGLGELLAAGLIAAPATRRAGGRLAAGLLIAFVPAHLHTFRVVRGEPGPTLAAAVRLPLQLPLIRAALRLAR